MHSKVKLRPILHDDWPKRLGENRHLIRALKLLAAVSQMNLPTMLALFTARNRRMKKSKFENEMGYE